MSPMNPTDEVDKATPTVVRLVGSLLGAAVYVGAVVVAVRLATSPDAGRTAAMRLYRTGARCAMYQARVWAAIADKCDAAYDAARVTSVYQ